MNKAVNNLLKTIFKYTKQASTNHCKNISRREIEQLLSSMRGGHVIVSITNNTKVSRV